MDKRRKFPKKYYPTYEDIEDFIFNNFNKVVSHSSIVFYMRCNTPFLVSLAFPMDEERVDFIEEKVKEYINELTM